MTLTSNCVGSKSITKSDFSSDPDSGVALFQNTGFNNPSFLN